MTTAVAQFEGAMTQLPLVAILRGLTPDAAAPIGSALVDEGWLLIEVPLNSPRPERSIEVLATRSPSALVGAGTVLTAAQVRSVHAAGARWVVSPHFDAGVVAQALALGMVCVPGVATPTEAFAAVAAGAHALKLFPAEMITPSVVAALRAVLDPRTVVLPVGGITAQNMAAYRRAGANGAGLGSALYRPGMDAATLAPRARALATAWRAAAP